jgi:hypothetical protein
VYPANDLIISLLDLYFTTVHPTIPILHRPSFERSVAEGLHLTDTDFGGTLLSVLAVASRVSSLCVFPVLITICLSQYSDDPRVFVDGITPLSSGWKFASQVRILPKLSLPTIHEVQMYCVRRYAKFPSHYPHIGLVSAPHLFLCWNICDSSGDAVHGQSVHTIHAESGVTIRDRN